MTNDEAKLHNQALQVIESYKANGCDLVDLKSIHDSMVLDMEMTEVLEEFDDYIDKTANRAELLDNIQIHALAIRLWEERDENAS